MGIGDVVKNGWHPEGKKGGKESWRGDFKGVNQVAGWMGKGKDDTKHSEAAHNHTSKPISALQDPSSFGPPPKHRDYYGEQAATASIPPGPSQSTSSQTTTSHVQSHAVPHIAPGPKPDISPRQEQEPRDEASEEPAGPFRIDTTGLNTVNLPPPPQHRAKRLITRSHSPVKIVSPMRTGSPAAPPQPPARTNVANQSATMKSKPTLPPRVPPRTAVAGASARPGIVPDSPPPPYSETSPSGHLSQPASTELETRLARMRAKIDGDSTGASNGREVHDSNSANGRAPPPVPVGTKPR